MNYRLKILAGGARGYEIRLGCLSIGYIFKPKPGRPFFIGRLMFMQEPGTVDFDKDRKFATSKQANDWVLTSFKKVVSILHKRYIIDNEQITQYDD